jgi:hypothetical protein
MLDRVSPYQRELADRRKAFLARTAAQARPEKAEPRPAPMAEPVEKPSFRRDMDHRGVWTKEIFDEACALRKAGKTAEQIRIALNLEGITRRGVISKFNRAKLAPRPADLARTAKKARVEAIEASIRSRQDRLRQLRDEMMRLVAGGLERTPSVRDIQTITAEHFVDMTRDTIAGNRRFSPIMVPRQVAMYLATWLTKSSLTTIGRSFDRDHTTIIHARDKTKKMIAADPQFRERVELIATDIIYQTMRANDGWKEAAL